MPVDCYPVPDSVPPLARAHWASASSTLRAAVAASRAGDVYPLLLGAYGCGPNSFVEHLFNDLLADHPHTVLESDGHGGKAGYVTRVQAFLHAVRSHREEETVRAGRSMGEQRVRAGVEGSEETLLRIERAAAEKRLARYDVPVPRSLQGNEHRKMYFGNVGGALGRQLAAAMRGAGLDVEFVGATDAEALQRARDVCSGKECLPYQLIWGTLARFLEEHEADARRRSGRLGRRVGTAAGDGDGPGRHGTGDLPLFISIGRGFQACRANVFPTTQEIGLAGLGLGDRVEVADFTHALPGLVPDRGGLGRHRRRRPAQHDALLPLRDGARARRRRPRLRRTTPTGSRSCSRGRAGTARPAQAGGACSRRRGETWTRCAPRSPRSKSSWRARRAPSPAYRGTRSPGRRDLRDVFLCGDIYLRVDEWGNDDLQRKLADQGLRPIMEPFGEFFELLCLRDVQEHGLQVAQGAAAGGDAAHHALHRRAPARRRTRATSRGSSGTTSVTCGTASRELFDGYPFGESIPTIGGALHTWRREPVDGVVVVSPRGCGPALVSEAQLRRHGELPLLFVYNDGDPIDGARVAGFAWRLCATPSRRPSPPSRAMVGFSQVHEGH